jgi:hypothetical protein
MIEYRNWGPARRVGSPKDNIKQHNKESQKCAMTTSKFLVRHSAVQRSICEDLRKKVDVIAKRANRTKVDIVVGWVSAPPFSG